MNRYEIKDMFSAYCKALNLTEGKNLHLPDGKYELAIPGTIFFSESGDSRHRTYAIMRNGENGTVSTIFGHCKGDRIFGYMEGIISANSRPAEPLDIVNMDSEHVFSFLVDAGVSCSSDGDSIIFVINDVGYRFKDKD